MSENKLCGRVTLLAAHRIPEAQRQTLTVKDIMSPDWDTALAEEDLFTILKRFAARDVGNLPVVTRDKPDAFRDVWASVWSRCFNVPSGHRSRNSRICSRKCHLQRLPVTHSNR